MTSKIEFKTAVIAILLSVLMLLNPAANKVQAQGNYDNSYQQFYNDLAPYGQWYQDPQYGFVWAPNAGSSFRPYYTNGNWAMTEYGNMWVSNYAWGWAPFHYGRWILSDYYGWIWIPGNEWGPAWVTWRQGGGYYGWAPMGPGISINISFGNNYYLPDPYWTFIPYNYMYNRSFQRYYSPRRTRTIINNTTVINNTYIDNRTKNTYVTGPRRSDVETRTGRKIDQYQVSSRDRAGASTIQGKSVTVYRPNIVNDNRSVAAPKGVKQLKESVAPRNTTNSNVRQSQPNVQKGNTTTPIQKNTKVNPSVRENNANTNNTVPQQVPNNNQRAVTPKPVRPATPVKVPEPVRNTAPPAKQAPPVKQAAPVKQPAPVRQAAPVRQVAPVKQVQPARQVQQPVRTETRDQNAPQRK